MRYSIKDIKRLLRISDYGYSSDDWFFPTDLSPHNNALKYACKKLYEEGKLERSERSPKYGYRYKIKKGSKK